MNTQHKLLSSCPVSCFADEIAESLDRQIEVLSRLGISYIELRSADGINVSDFTMDFAKEVKKKGEEAKVAVRNIRRDGNVAFKKLKGTEVSEDEIKDLEDELQKITDKYIAQVDKMVEAKSKEIMTV